jgi:alpha-beta hydrolase superfamily lysophospholipase
MAFWEGAADENGAGEAERLGWGGQLVPGLVQAGLAVLSYDKRGVGQSEGDCCPGDQGHFNLLTADVEGAVRVLRAHNAVNPDKVGLVGASQAGWIAPRAANDTHAAFVALASAPTVSERVANLYERLAGGEKGHTHAGGDQPPPQEGRLVRIHRRRRPRSSAGSSNTSVDFRRPAAPSAHR